MIVQLFYTLRLFCLAAVTVLLLSACGDSGGGESDDDNFSQRCEQAIAESGCSIAVQNQCVHSILQEYYLWNDQIPDEIDYDSFASPQETLDFLRYLDPGPDIFSYLTPQSSFEELTFEGQYIGLGFSSVTDVDGRLWIRYIYTDSPAGRAGLARGDEIISIDGQLLTDITSQPDWQDIFGPAVAGYDLDMVVGKNGGGNISLTLTKSTVFINSVLHQSVIDNSGTPTGYLVYNRFLRTSLAELDTAFEQFSNAGVTRLVLDLRYNTGGNIAVANTLASYLSQAVLTDSVFGRLVFNEDNQRENRNYLIEDIANQLALDQLTIITTGETASASEMIVNGLDPFIPVNTIGSATFGKPVGQNPFYFCDNALLPITFRIENSIGVGDYFDGLDADCAASDDVSFAFGRLDEPMLEEALFFERNNSCQTSTRAARAKSDAPAAYKTRDNVPGNYLESVH